MSKASGSGTPPDLEIELKFDVAPERLAALRAAAPLKRGATGGGSERHLLSTYFDTEDLQLRRNGVALRVRKVGQRHIQTVKANGQAGDVLRRGEFEGPVSEMTPDLDAIADQAMRERIGMVFDAELRPLFTTDVKRTASVVETQGEAGARARVEVAFDKGRILAGDSAVPLSEMELELKDGAPAALFDLAAALHAVEPLRLNTASKALMGYRLATGARPEWHKAEKLALNKKMTVCDALHTILRTCLVQWMANAAAAEDGGDPEGVHQMRVALRRMRSALSVFRPVLPPGKADRFREDLKWLAGTLGPARDWDVFLAELLEPVDSARAADKDLMALRKAGEQARRRGYDLVRKTMDDPRYTALLLEVGGWIEGRRWRAEGPDHALLNQPIRDLADTLLNKRHRKARKLGRDFATLHTEGRHEVRIALKKLRYAIDFLGSLYGPAKSKSYVKALARMQDDLGHLNDVATAETMLSELRSRRRAAETKEALQRAAGTVIGWHERGLADREPRLVADWQAFMAQRPFWG